jgi:hypothetical protein
MLPIDSPMSDVKPPSPARQMTRLLGILLVGSWIVIAVINPLNHRPISIGYLIGTIYGQTTLAAGWTVFGVPRIGWRLVIALGWIITLVIALAVNLHLHSGDDDFIFVFALCLGGQWMVAQGPLWIMAFCLRMRLHHASHVEPLELSAAPQFGIWQMMTFTTAIALLLGIGRLSAPWITLWFGGEPEAFLFVFLSIAAVITSLPTLIAALLPRHAIVATIASLLLIAPVTYAEWPLMDVLGILEQGGPELWGIIVYINVFTAGWVAVVAWLLRAGGYRLGH